MTRDDIIRMAQEAGWPASVLHPHGAGVDTSEYLLVPTLVRFAALVAAAEREACAQVATKMLRFYTQGVTGVPEAIRARGKEWSSIP